MFITTDLWDITWIPHVGIRRRIETTQPTQYQMLVKWQQEGKSKANSRNIKQRTSTNIFSLRRSEPRPPHCQEFMVTIGRTPLDEWSARNRDLYLTTHYTRKGETSMPPVGFEPTIPASKRPQTQALDRAATGIGKPNTDVIIVVK